MRLNSALVSGSCLNLFGSVLSARMFRCWHSYWIHWLVLPGFIIEDYRTRHGMLACYSRAGRVVNECTTLFCNAKRGERAHVNHHGLLSREISGYVFHLINIQSFFMIALSFSPFTQERHVIGRLRGIH